MPQRVAVCFKRQNLPVGKRRLAGIGDGHKDFERRVRLSPQRNDGEIRKERAECFPHRLAAGMRDRKLEPRPICRRAQRLEGNIVAVPNRQRAAGAALLGDVPSAADVGRPLEPAAMRTQGMRPQRIDLGRAQDESDEGRAKRAPHEHMRPGLRGPRAETAKQLEAQDCVGCPQLFILAQPAVEHLMRHFLPIAPAQRAVRRFPQPVLPLKRVLLRRLFRRTAAAGQQLVDGHAEQVRQAPQQPALRPCGVALPLGYRLIGHAREPAELCLRQTVFLPQTAQKHTERNLFHSGFPLSMDLF